MHSSHRRITTLLEYCSSGPGLLHKDVVIIDIIRFSPMNFVSFLALIEPKAGLLYCEAFFLSGSHFVYLHIGVSLPLMCLICSSCLLTRQAGMRVEGLRCVTAQGSLSHMLW